MPSEIFMIAPDHFGYNTETAGDNYFQKKDIHDTAYIRSSAHEEFQSAVHQLRELGIKVHLIHSSSTSPDAVFPNNWISFHKEGYVLYSMRSELRRSEIRPEILQLSQFRDRQLLLDLRPFANKGEFLEGTGSLVLDRTHKIAFAGLSGRTHERILDLWSKELGYDVIRFHALDSGGRNIYHTNVMMAIGPSTAILCADSITDPKERSHVRKVLEKDHELVMISLEQMENFAGNTIFLEGQDKGYWIMSKTALSTLTSDQIVKLERDGPIVPLEIPTIESLGGGSIRCMICEMT